MAYNWKNSLLPPKSPFPSISPSYTEYVPSSVIGPKVLPKPREANSHHQRAASESVLIEEQPLWLDELLNEPETPVRRGGHRRSSSDSFVYIDSANVGSMNISSQDDNKLKILTPAASWGSQDFDIFSDIKNGSFYMDTIPSGKISNKLRDTPVSSISSSCGLSTLRCNSTIPNSGSLRTSQEADKNTISYTEKQDYVESYPQDPRGYYNKKDPFQKSSSSETDTKRAKQQFAQRSRVRKLQYIAELERNVQGLQAKGSEVSAELEFLNQQNLILSMENKALKQHLESLAQEQVIKYLEHEVLEREAKRLRSLYQQQQVLQQPQFSSCHRHANSKDLDQQLANLSLNIKEPNTARVSSPKI